MDTLLTDALCAVEEVINNANKTQQREERRHPQYRDPDEWRVTHIIGVGDVCCRWYYGHRICVDMRRDGSEAWLMWIDRKFEGVSLSLEEAERRLEEVAKRHPAQNFEFYYHHH